jgi:hypothetical protein
MKLERFCSYDWTHEALMDAGEMERKAQRYRKKGSKI